MIKYLRALFLFLAPSFLIKLATNGKIVKCGFSIILVNKCKMEGGKIGHFNFIKVENLVMQKDSVIRNLNFIRGNFSLQMEDKAVIGNLNKFSSISRSTYQSVVLSLGERCHVVGNHLFDMTSSISIGEHTTLGGVNTQIWTHGFYKSSKLENSPRIDAPVKIGCNCYIGARCSIMPGVVIADDITVGAQTCISKSLTKSGLYVSQPIRYIDFDVIKAIENLRGSEVAPNVYNKTIKKN